MPAATRRARLRRLWQGVAAVAVCGVCKAATSEDKAEAAWHADPSMKSAAVPVTHKAVEFHEFRPPSLHVDLHAVACARRTGDLQGQQLVPTSQTELTPTSRC
jgi:hypothetical protein